MALPDTFTMSRNGARFFASRILADNVIADTNGVWWDTLQLHPFTIVISGDWTVADGGGVSIYVSNGVLGYDTQGRAIVSKPADTDNNWPTLGPQLILGPYGAVSDGPYRWVKVRLSLRASGTMRAAFSAATNVGEKG